HRRPPASTDARHLGGRRRFRLLEFPGACSSSPPRCVVSLRRRADEGTRAASSACAVLRKSACATRKGSVAAKKNRTGPSAPVRPPPAPRGLRPRHARTRCVDSTARKTTCFLHPFAMHRKGAR